MQPGSRSAARPDGRCTAVLLTIYACLVLLIVSEQFGATTNDTRLELTEGPRDLLASTFSLWNPDTSRGDLQNQA